MTVGTIRRLYHFYSGPQFEASHKMRQEGILGNWALHSLNPEDIENATDNLIKKAEAEYDKVGKLTPEDVNFENCIQPLLNVECILLNEEGPLDFPQHAVTNKALRDASVAAAKKLNAFNVEIAMRKDVFDNLNAFSSKKGMMDKLSPEQKRFVEKDIVDGKRNGLHLDEKTREEIKKIKKEISDLGTTFGSNLNEDTTFLCFTEDELKGVPEDLVKSFEKDGDNKCKVTLKYPHFFPVTRKCRNSETRRRIETAYQARCMEENTKILEKLVELRQRRADLLGYKNHATYIQEVIWDKRTWERGEVGLKIIREYHSFTAVLCNIHKKGTPYFFIRFSFVWQKIRKK